MKASTSTANAARALPAGQIAALVAGAVLLTILGGTMSLTPLIWNDSTTFISSALATLASGTLVLHAGRGPGYVELLAELFKWSGSLQDLVLIQHAAWCASMALIAFTVVRLLRWPYALLLLPLAMYPGIQYFQNIVMAESLYTSAITCAVCLLLLAARTAHTLRDVALLLGAVVLAAFAGLLKPQGIAPFSVIALGALWAAWRFPSRGAVIPVALVACLAAVQLGGSLQSKAQSSDPGSALFGSKTLFCIHLDLVLASETTTPLAQQAFGANATAFLRLLHRDLLSTAGEFKTLGFYADACQYDDAMDRLGIESVGVVALNRWYREAFVSAVLRHPVRYGHKVAVQLVYGLKMAVPPLALGQTYSSAPEQQGMVDHLMSDAGLRGRGPGPAETVTAPAAAQTEPFTSPALRLLSLATSLALVGALAGILWPAWRRHPDAFLAALTSLVWFAQIGGVALTHTLDVWRYISPVVPLAIMVLAFVLRISVDLMNRQVERA